MEEGLMNNTEITDFLTEAAKTSWHVRGSLGKRLTDVKRFENETHFLTMEEQFGGREGAGELTWMVFNILSKLSGETVYVKFTGWYDSYDGSQYDAPFEKVTKQLVQKHDWVVTNE